MKREAGTLEPVPDQPADEKQPLSLPRGPLLLLGVLASMGLIAEGAMYDWSVLFMKQEVVNGLKVSWIESKANFGDIVEMKKNLSKQLVPYVKLFGKGIVVYWFGYVTDVDVPEGITTPR